MAPEPVIDRARLLATRVNVPQHVVHRSFQSETVMLNLETGQYHGLNPIAGRMLEELERQESIAAAAAAIASEYGQPEEEVAADLCNLCLGLRSRGLVSLGIDEEG